MREWCVVLDLTSADAAKQIGRALRGEGRALDLETGETLIESELDPRTSAGGSA